MTNHPEILGTMIRNYRIKSGWTQLELAEKLGYNTPQFVSLFERGLSKIPLETLGRLIIYLKMPEKEVLKILLSTYEADLKHKLSLGKKAAGK
jgi:transcriptional regulator with XRE-family HTH domain